MNSRNVVFFLLLPTGVGSSLPIRVSSFQYTKMNTFCGTVGREIGLQNISCENHFSRRRQWENHELAPEANLEKKETDCVFTLF